MEPASYSQPAWATGGAGLSTDHADPYPSPTVPVSKAGDLFHATRLVDGNRTSFSPLDGYAGSARFAARAEAIAGMPNGDAQLTAVGDDGMVYHNALYASGSWQGGWNTSSGGQKAAIAGMKDGGAQMVVSRS
ncbi:hypothetical protein P3T27_003044 [Kitasatospora sp. MAA19]|uniref:hypothetical protein n=1 Tax=unclassified Kitasatospora TaxID=2633591 RepID=UPI0024734B3C|nr:hypothetical protein [Kitasatospora sp. MAA19]MDH6706321.1 hypothetical protein [Kitasatospora sp. MAA19]